MTVPSAARRQQLTSDDQDDQLTVHARARRPGVRHWWGRRTWFEDVDSGATRIREQGPAGDNAQYIRTGAICYLCDQPIVTWPSRWPISEAARAAIALHRDQEIGRLLGHRPHSSGENR